MPLEIVEVSSLFKERTGEINMRETVRSISGIPVRYLRGDFLSTRGPGSTDLWFTSCHASGIRWVAMSGEDKC